MSEKGGIDKLKAFKNFIMPDTVVDPAVGIELKRASLVSAIVIKATRYPHCTPEVNAASWEDSMV